MLPNRKALRLRNFDYNQPGTYFITICTEGRRQCLSRVVKTADGYTTELSPQGKIAVEILAQLEEYYKNILIEHYIIMPDHIHLLLTITQSSEDNRSADCRNSTIAKFVGTFKRFCNRQYQENIWQGRYYDHVIRNQKDFNIILEYINSNPTRWGMHM